MPAQARLPMPIATLYSELHDLTQWDSTLRRHIGGFSVKEIGGHRYWYHQRWVGARRVQKAEGPESPEVLERIRKWKHDAEAWRNQARLRRQLIKSLRAVLGITMDRLTGKVLRELSDAGVFEAGVILIGTHAYMTYGPMLGVRLAAANVHTGDIDFGAVDLAVTEPSISFPDAVQAAEENFFIVPPAPGKKISTALKYRGGEARVELLTPLDKGVPWEPVIIKSLQFGAQKAPFLDYLIKDPVEATYLAEEGIRVRVPDPARFALHKLIVAANRHVASQNKAAKDKAQASELITALDPIRPGDLRRAAKDLKTYGERYVEMVFESLETMTPELREKIALLIG